MGSARGADVRRVRASRPGRPVTPPHDRTRRTGTAMSGFSEAERVAMRRALVIAATPGVPLGPNPRVGCVLLDADGRQVAEGFHRGAGTPHAEVAALQGLPGSAAGL